MIVVCPACQTRFTVDDGVLGGLAGRRLRCASCGNLWHYSPEAAMIQAASAEAEAAEAHGAGRPPEFGAVPPPLGQSAFAEAPAGPSAMPRPSVTAELPAAVRRREIRFAVYGLAGLAVILVLFAVFGSGAIISLWPSARPIYQTLHLVAAPGAGLKVTVTPTRTPEALIIDGSIVNDAAAPRRIPRLRVTLRDGNKAVLASQIIAPPVARLSPGERARFNATFEHPSITATGVEVTFVSD